MLEMLTIVGTRSPLVFFTMNGQSTFVGLDPSEQLSIIWHFSPRGELNDLPKMTVEG